MLEETHLSVFFLAPFILADLRVDFVTPALRALLSGSAGHLVSHGCPAVTVLGLLCEGGGEKQY